MEKRMNRTLLVCLVLAAGAATLAAQQEGQTNPYAGTSNPPQDDIIVTTSAQPIPKPSAAHPLATQPAAPAAPRYQQPAPSYTGRPGTDDGIVQMTPDASYQDPEANLYQPLQRTNRYDPAPSTRTQPASRYPATQTDPYYQDAPAPARSSRYAAQSSDPYYQQAPATGSRTSSYPQNNRYPSSQPDPYAQETQGNSYPAAQQDPYYQQQTPQAYRPAQNPQYQSTQPDPYVQKAPTRMYRPPQLSQQPAQTSGYTATQADPYYQGQPGAQSQSGTQGQSGAASSPQNSPYYQQGAPYAQPQGAYDPYYQGNPNGQPTNSYGDPQYQPTLSHRVSPTYDPDGDIVRPSALGMQQIAEGTTIRVSLLGRISSADAVNGQRFRTRVVNDVIQNGRVLIPADSEIDGQIFDISRGHVGSGGSMHLRPETVILRDGTRFKLYAQVTGAPDANAHIGTEGTVHAGSRMKRDSIEYGSAMGVGAGTGAYLGGPAGAVAGTLIGAGVITAHLLISHPQATLESGTHLQFTLTQRLSLVPSPYGD